MAELKAKIGLDTSAFETGLARLQNTAGSFAKGIGGLFLGAFAFDKIASGFSAILEKAGKLQDISDKFGVSAEAVQRIGNAAEQSGGSLESVAKALGRIGVSAQEAAGGNEKLQKAFVDIGVSGQQLLTLSPEQLFYKLANAMNDGSLAGKDLAVAKELLGKGFMDLLPVLRMTENEIRAIGEASGVLSDDAVAKLDQFGDSWTRLSNKVKVGAATMIDAFIRLGEEIARNPMNLITGDWDKMEKNMNARIDQEKRLREAMQARTRSAGTETQDSMASKEFQKERDKSDVAAARQELRMLEAGLAGRDAAEKMLRDFEERKKPAAAAGPDAIMATTGNPLRVLADSLQQVGGGGRFAQISGGESVQKDIAKNTRETAEAVKKLSGATFDGMSFDIGVQ